MGRLQDKQYAPTKKKEKAESPGNEKLKALFCPPLDQTLVEAIWNDSLDYGSSYQILKDLALETDSSHNEIVEQGTMPSGEILPVANEYDYADGSSDGIEDEELPDIMANNVDFLIKCFPNHDNQVRAVLRDQDNDVEKATDILLNSVFLDNDDQDDSDSMDVFKEKRRQKKQQQKKNVIWTSGQLPIGINGYASEMLDDYGANDLATVPFNYWHQYDDKVERLQPIFSTVRRNIIHQCVQSCRGDEIAAVVMIMEKEPKATPIIEQNWHEVKELEQIQEGLAAILIDRTKLQVKRIAVGLLVHAVKRQSVEQMVKEGVNFALNNEAQQKARARRFEQQEQPIRNNTDVHDMPMIPDYLKERADSNLPKDDPEECRALALELLLERNELFCKAAASHQQSKNKKEGEGGVAFFYAEEARKLDAKARELNMRAAKAFVQEKQMQQNDEYLLDLHGLTVAESQVIVHEAVTQWWSRSQTQLHRRRLQPLKVVTGVGKHSAHGKSKLLPSVLKLLKRGGWKFEQPYSGCIHVCGLVEQPARLQ